MHYSKKRIGCPLGILAWWTCTACAAPAPAATTVKLASRTTPSDATLPPARLRVEASTASAALTSLGWDTEGGDRAEANLLRAPVALRALKGGREVAPGTAFSAPDANAVKYRLSLGETAALVWQTKLRADGIAMDLACEGDAGATVDALELLFPFDPRITPTTAVPSRWHDDGHLSLPAIVSAPDFGQMMLAGDGAGEVRGRLEGSRAHHAVDLVVELPVPRAGTPIELRLTPVLLPPPAGLRDVSLWAAARRGWFGAFQSTARWGDPGNPFSAPAGMLGNNVVSDPASCSLWFYADQAFFTPELAPGIAAMSLVRRTLDWWLDHKVLPDGEMICYWDKTHFLDANAGPLIAAWDCVETTRDLAWLRGRIEVLERLADYLARRDVDGDGMVEAVQSGNHGTLKQPGRSCAWWDALNCGHKDSYSNALIYRAWRCLADLEAKVGRADQAGRYGRLADRLKAAYQTTLFNPKTGWLAWWKSEDGELHDYASPVTNGLAIEYGLVEPAAGRDMLARLRRKIEEVGFTRFDLGVPPQLVPVRRGDYLLPDAAGLPEREDGTDTFGYYMNGGITAGQVLHFLAAHYVVGEGAHADRILRAMLERQTRGGFQNGAVNAYPQGIDWTTWDGKPAGYEGYLADSFRFLQAVLLREEPFRARLYRPLAGGQAGARP